MNVELKIPVGAKVRIGQPNKPNRTLARAIARLLSALPEVREAHFPQCYVPGTMPKAAQVLMLVFDESCDVCEALIRIRRGLTSSLSPNSYVDIWNIGAAGPFLQSVRESESRIIIRMPSGKAIREDPWSFWNRLLRRLRDL